MKPSKLVEQAKEEGATPVTAKDEEKIGCATCALGDPCVEHDTETAVAERPEAMPAVPMADRGLTGNFDESDQVIPAWFLVQPTSTEFPDAEQGQFATADGRVADSLIIVPLRIAATRALWPAEMGDGRRPLCGSQDRFEGQPFGDYVPYDSPAGEPASRDGGGYLCQECPHSEDQPWTVENGCYKGYAILFAVQGIDAEAVDDEPGVLRIKGTSMAPVKAKLLSHFLRKNAGPVWSKSFELTSELATSDKGKYYIVVPRLVTNVADPQRYGDLARELAGVNVVEETPIEEEGGEMDD